MLLEFYGIKVKEIELRKLFNTTPLFGTKWSTIVEKIKKYNLEFVYLKNQTFEKLNELIKNEIPVIVSVDTFFLGDERHKPHTTVIKAVNDKIFCNDPERGENIEIDKDRFLMAWSARNRRIGYVKKALA
jgi:ABC-type bacteriocin/lantibiotic exporter with double-glycine peptidase domain